MRHVTCGITDDVISTSIFQSYVLVKTYQSFMRQKMLDARHFNKGIKISARFGYKNWQLSWGLAVFS